MFDETIIMNHVRSFPCRVELLYRASGMVAGEATGFFVFLNGKYYFVTNRHVLTGRDPHTDAPLHSSGLDPDTINIYIQKQNFPNPFSIELINDYGERKYKLHPNDEVDIGVIETSIDGAFVLDLGVNSPLINCPISAGLGGEISVIGYPNLRGNYHGQVILKNCNIASQDTEKILINGTTVAGMSGSPVFIIRSGSITTTNGSIINNGTIGVKFIGIYSERIREGRLEADHSTLGVVLSTKLIEECL